MAFNSFRDFVNALDKAGELKRIFQPVRQKCGETRIDISQPEDYSLVYDTSANKG